MKHLLLFLMVCLSGCNGSDDVKPVINLPVENHAFDDDLPEEESGEIEPTIQSTLLSDSVNRSLNRSHSILSGQTSILPPALHESIVFNGSRFRLEEVSELNPNESFLPVASHLSSFRAASEVLSSIHAEDSSISVGENEEEVSIHQSLVFNVDQHQLAHSEELHHGSLLLPVASEVSSEEAAPMVLNEIETVISEYVSGDDFTLSDLDISNQNIQQPMQLNEVDTLSSFEIIEGSDEENH